MPNRRYGWARSDWQPRLFLRTYENPRPTVPITTLAFVAATNVSSAPFLLAATVE